MLRMRKSMIFVVILWSISTAWEILPVQIDENTQYDKKSKNHIHIIQNKDAASYRIHGTNAEPFEIETISDGSCGNNNGKTCGRLWLKDDRELDREAQEQYVITVEALNRNKRIIESSEMVINVHDENDNAPSFTAASLTLKCKENSGNGHVCGHVQATDADAGNYGEVEYSLENRGDRWKKRTGELETRQLGMFDIDPQSGDVTMKNPQDWDAEIYEYVEITVSATDNPGKSSHNPPVTATIKIYIDDVNDNEPQVVDYEKTILVGELTPAGTNIGSEKYNNKYSFLAEDKDVDPDNRNVMFEIVSPSSSPFEIINQDVPENSAVLQIGAEMLDYETRETWKLEIRAVNTKGIPSKQQNFNVVINVKDENEPPVWDDNQVVFDEGAQKGSSPISGQPHARDLDFGGSQKVSYTITKDPEEFFNINGDSGYITYKNDIPLDRECTNCDWLAGTYPLEIKACDTMDLCNTKTHHIFINDNNDEGPRVDLEEQVCNELDESYVLIKGNRQITVVDRDDCKLNHCGPFDIEVIGHYSNKFKLEKQSDKVYALRYLPTGKLEISKVYEIQVRGFDEQRNQYDSTIKLSVCSCTADDANPSCANSIIGEGGGSLASIMAIIAAVLIVFIVVLLLIVYRVRHRHSDGKENLLDDEDDERANIMVYHTEGGGEEDQADFDPQSLVRARTQQEQMGAKRPQRPKPGYPGIPPEDIGQYINAAKEHADEDPSSPPYDSLLTFDYEGGNSICADLSSLGSNGGDPDEDDNYLNNWGPKFRKLADLYAGRDNEAYDPSNI